MCSTVKLPYLQRTFLSPTTNNAALNSLSVWQLQIEKARGSRNDAGSRLEPRGPSGTILGPGARGLTGARPHQTSGSDKAPLIQLSGIEAFLPSARPALIGWGVFNWGWLWIVSLTLILINPQRVYCGVNCVGAVSSQGYSFTQFYSVWLSTRYLCSVVKSSRVFTFTFN